MGKKPRQSGVDGEGHYDLPVIDPKEPEMVFARLKDRYLSDHLKSFGCHQGRHTSGNERRGERMVDLTWHKDAKSGEYRITILPDAVIKAEEAGEVVTIRTVEYWETRYKERGYDVRILKEWRKDGYQHIVIKHFIAEEKHPYFLEKLRISFKTARKRMVTQSLTAEMSAQKKLRELLTKYQWKSYQLNGSFFLEGKYGYYYWVRKGLPTIICSRGKKHETWFHGSFCYHALGYHRMTFAGAEVPTEDVLAVYLMIRTDEKRFVRKATYHKLDDPLGGV